MRIFSSVALAALLSTVPQIAHAQDDDAAVTQMAKEHYKAGLDAYKAGKYDVAIKELKKAYLLKRLPALLLNIGATYRKMGDYDLALHFYGKYLEEAPPEAKDRDDVGKIIADIKAEKANGAQAPTEEAKAPPPEEAPPPPKPQPAREWSHNVVDAAPPDSPLDVRVQTPVLKGVKVYLYYRGAGEEHFKSVVMHRKGPEKIGRIPADAMQGKAMQYYIEAKAPDGSVVKSSGSEASPNVVLIDPSAPPQVVASAEERRGEEPATEDEERPRNKKKQKDMGDLDEETAPVTGEVSEPRHKRARGAGAPSRFGPMFWAGLAMGVAGVAGVAAGIGLGVAAQQKANQVADDALHASDPGNHYYFNNDPSNPGVQDATLQNQGKTFDAAGIACDVVGGVLVATGVTLMVVDQVGRHGSEKPKKARRRAEPVEESKATPWYVAPSAGPRFVGVGGGFQF